MVRASALGRVVALLLVLGLVLPGAGVADHLTGAGDTYLPDGVHLTIGDVIVGSLASGVVDFRIHRYDETNNEFADATEVIVSVDPYGTQTGPSATIDCSGDPQIQLPADWNSLGNGSLSIDGATCNVSIDTTGLVVGQDYQSVIGMRAVGVRAGGYPLTRRADLVVTFSLVEEEPSGPEYTISQFFAPVVEGVNEIKGGRTIKLAFRVFDGDTEITDVAVVTGFDLAATDCTTDAVLADGLEFTDTGHTTLQYDGSAGAFARKWKTPKGAGCYRVTVTVEGGAQLTADFAMR